VQSVTYPEFYAEVFTALARPLTAADQVSEEVIRANEQRLGVCLPQALRWYFTTGGNMRQLNQAYNRLLAPETWRLDRRVLVFLSENQGVVKWGVKAGKVQPDDPAVLYTTADGHGGHSDWAPEELVCSDFLVLMLCWQATHGGLPYTGWAQVDPAVGEAVANCLGPVWRTRDLRASYGPGQVVCVAGRTGRLDVLAAGRSGAEFGALVRQLAGLGVRLEMQ
jgi:hypothetical protein